MVSFQTFLKEAAIATNKRQGLTHLRDMKPIDFINWLDSVKTEAKGLLSGKNIKASIKADGVSFRVGKSSDGTPFIEGSRTGPQTSRNAFSNYIKTNRPDADSVSLERAVHYDKILDHFIDGKATRKLMSLVPNNVKVYCELFYVPMANFEDDTGISFVTIKYDKNKLGSLMTIAVYDIFEADTGKKHPDADKIKKELIQKGSTSEVKVISSDLTVNKSIDISGEISLVQQLITDKTETIRVLGSRKGVDREKKQNIISLINIAKEKLGEKLLFNPNICGMDRLCDTEKGEGLVFHLSTGQSIKVINPDFEDQHHGAGAHKK